MSGMTEWEHAKAELWRVLERPLVRILKAINAALGWIARGGHR
jgi:hypothetical protein